MRSRGGVPDSAQRKRYPRVEKTTGCSLLHQRGQPPDGFSYSRKGGAVSTANRGQSGQRVGAALSTDEGTSAPTFDPHLAAVMAVARAARLLGAFSPDGTAPRLLL